MHSVALDTRIGLIAERQGGAFSWAQARSCGFGKATIGRRVRDGRWRRVLPGVYVLTGSPPSRLLDLWAAVLAVGDASPVSHESAALYHGARRLPLHPITLTNPHGAHHRLPGIVVHQIDDVAPWHVMRIGGLPIVTAARSVVELGACLPLARLGDVADDLVQARATSWAAIDRVFSDVLRPGKPGMATVAALLDDRCRTSVPAGSKLERALFTALAAGGLPAPARQVPLPGDGPRRGLVDAAYLDAKLIIEADGRTYHMRFQDMRRDRERDATATAAGWVTMRFVYEQIVDDPATVVSQVAQALEVRRHQLGEVA